MRRKTQASHYYNCILDYTFVAHLPENWLAYSAILTPYFPFEDDPIITDHRPIEATFLIGKPATEETPVDSP